MEIKLTVHPPWVKEFLEFIAPYKDAIVNGRYFSEMAAGTLSMARCRGGLYNFYPLIENFPVYMAGVLEKVPAGGNPRNDMVRNWLMSNINTERQHAIWYRQWASDFGVPQKAFNKPVVPPAEMDAVNNYLWRIANHGTLVECIAAINYAIEGPTGEWTKEAKPNIRKYEKQPGVTFGKKTLFWINAHARYDDKHTPEALELMKAFATTKQEQEKVKLAAQRTMEYYAMAADACYEIFG